MPGKFILYEDEKGEYRWRLLARNGRIIADSGEGYKTKWGAVRAIGNLQKYANSPIYDMTGNKKKRLI